MSQPYQDLLAATAAKLGLEPGAFRATQEVVVDGLPVGLRLEGEGDKAEVLLCSLLAAPSAELWDETASALLMANHLWSGTGGAILGVLPQSRMVTLSARQRLRDLDPDQLIELVAKTADTGLAWQAYIARSPALHGSGIRA